MLSDLLLTSSVLFFGEPIDNINPLNPLLHLPQLLPRHPRDHCLQEIREVYCSASSFIEEVEQGDSNSLHLWHSWDVIYIVINGDEPFVYWIHLVECFFPVFDLDFRVDPPLDSDEVPVEPSFSRVELTVVWDCHLFLKFWDLGAVCLVLLRRYSILDRTPSIVRGPWHRLNLMNRWRWLWALKAFCFFVMNRDWFRTHDVWSSWEHIDTRNLHRHSSLIEVHIHSRLRPPHDPLEISRTGNGGQSLQTFHLLFLLFEKRCNIHLSRTHCYGLPLLPPEIGERLARD